MKLREGIIGLMIVFFIAIAPFNTMGQVGYVSSEKHNNLSESKTLVVLTGDGIYDKMLKEAMSELWDVNQYLFVSEEELSKSILKKGYFILIHQNRKLNRSSYGKLETLILFASGQPISKLTEENIYAQSAVGCTNDSRERVALKIKSILSTLELISSNKISSEAKMIVQDQIDVIHSKAKQLKTGTILIDKSLIGADIELAKIKAIYPHKIKLLTCAEINTILDEREKGFYILQPSNVAKIVVYNALTGEAVYASKSVRKEGDKQYNTKDFQELIDAVEK